MFLVIYYKLQKKITAVWFTNQRAN